MVLYQIGKTQIRISGKLIVNTIIWFVQLLIGGVPHSIDIRTGFIKNT